MLQGCGERERTSSSFTGSLGSIDSAMMVLSLYLLCSVSYTHLTLPTKRIV